MIVSEIFGGHWFTGVGNYHGSGSPHKPIRCRQSLKWNFGRISSCYVHCTDYRTVYQRIKIKISMLVRGAWIHEIKAPKKTRPKRRDGKEATGNAQ